MRTIIAIAFALCIVSISAVSSASFREARENEIANKLNELRSDAFGKKLLNTIAIELQTSDKVDTVINVVRQLQAALQEQQDTETASYTELQSRYTNVIQTQDDNIATSQNTISNLQGDIRDANQKLDSLTSERQQLINVRDSLVSFLATLAARRQSEAAAYEVRQQDQNDIVTGLSAVIQILQQEANEADNQTYNRDSLVNVLNKLNELSEAVSASLESDQNAESVAVVNYQAFVDKSNKQLSDIAVQINDLETQISATQALIVSLTNQVEAEQKKIVEYQKIRAEYAALLQTLEETYAANKAVRAKQIQLCEDVITILSTNLNKVKTYLGDNKVESV